MAPLWTPDAVQVVLTNPTYVGMGSYPTIVADERWIAANVRMIEERGARAVIRSILDCFQDAFPHLCAPKVNSYVQQAQDDPRAALYCLLTDLRELAAS